MSTGIGNGDRKVYDLNREVGQLCARVEDLDRKMDSFSDELAEHRREAAEQARTTGDAVAAINRRLDASDSERRAGQDVRQRRERRFYWAIGLLVTIALTVIGWLVA